MIKLTPKRLENLRDFFFQPPHHQPQVWLKPCEEPLLFFSGDGVAYDGVACILDYGSVASIGKSEREITVQNCGQEGLNVWLESENDKNERLTARWKERQNPVLLPGGDSAILETIFNGQKIKLGQLKRKFSLKAQTVANRKIQKTYSLIVRVNPHPNIPYGKYLFNGVPCKEKADFQTYDFGSINPLEQNDSDNKGCSFVIKNAGWKSLSITLLYCPKWLIVRAENRALSKSDVFKVHFNKTVNVSIKPVPHIKFAGSKKGIVIFQTNDKREEINNLELPFKCCQAIQAAHVKLENPNCLEVFTGQTHNLDIPLFNIGQSPADISIQSQNENIKVTNQLTIPKADAGKPSKTLLHTEINASRLEAGKHTLNLELTTDNNTLKIPVEIIVVKIENTPKYVDFGVVNSGDQPVITMPFTASDERKLRLVAKTITDVKANIGIKIVNGHTLKATLQDIPLLSGNRIEKYEDTGVVIADSASAFKRKIGVKFERTHPQLEIGPRETDMGEVVGGNTYEDCFTIYNKGNGVLDVEMQVEAPHLSIEGPLSFEVDHEKDIEINFSLDFSEEFETDCEFAYPIRINTNDSNIGSNQTINVKGKLLVPEYKRCAECDKISPIKDPFCSFCSAPFDRKKKEKSSTRQSLLGRFRRFFYSKNNSLGGEEKKQPGFFFAKNEMLICSDAECRYKYRYIWPRSIGKYCEKCGKDGTELVEADVSGEQVTEKDNNE